MHLSLHRFFCSSSALLPTLASQVHWPSLAEEMLCGPSSTEVVLCESQLSLRKGGNCEWVSNVTCEEPLWTLWHDQLDQRRKTDHKLDRVALMNKTGKDRHVQPDICEWLTTTTWTANYSIASWYIILSVTLFCQIFLFSSCAYTCAWVSLYMPHVYRCLRRVKVIRSPVTGVTGYCQLPDVAAGKWTSSFARIISVLDCWYISPASGFTELHF